MSLTNPQNEKVIEWIQQGLKLSEIQNRLASELDVRMTYMEVKMLLSDLQLKPKDQDPPKAATALNAPGGGSSGGSTSSSVPALSPDQADAAPSPGPDDATPGSPGGNVSVNVDTLTRAGAMVSGKVTFSDGKSADWYLDQYGRLGFAPVEKGYRPSQGDLVTFQTELQTQLAKLGY